VLGVLIAVLINKTFPGQGIVRVLLISPFFVMPAVNAVLWINMIMDPVLGYAEIEIVSRGNGNKNLPYLIGEFANNNIGAASATGIFAVILANIVAIFLLRMIGKTLMD